MKTSEKAKAVGLKSLNEMAELEGQTAQTLSNWDKNKPELFQAALDRAVKKKLEGIK